MPNLMFFFADFGRQEIRAAVNLPITDKIAIRASGLFAESDGYYKAGGFLMNAPLLIQLHFYLVLSHLLMVRPVTAVIWVARMFFQVVSKFSTKQQTTSQLLLQYEIIRDNSDAVPSVNETPTDIDPATGATRFAWAGPLFNAPVQPGDPLDNAASTDRDDNLLNMSQGHQVDVDGLYLNLEYAMDKGNVFFMAGKREQDSTST